MIDNTLDKQRHHQHRFQQISYKQLSTATRTTSWVATRTTSWVALPPGGGAAGGAQGNLSQKRTLGGVLKDRRGDKTYKYI